MKGKGGAPMNKLIRTCGAIIAETEKAVLLLHDHPYRPPVWLPKSQIQVRRCEWSDTVLIPKWLARKHKIEPKPTPKSDMTLNTEIGYANGMQNM
jgi:hypothetical protein